MQRDPDTSRPAVEMRGKHARVHLWAFGRQVVFITLCGAGAALFDRQHPLAGLSLMRTMFAFSTVFLALVALATRQREDPKRVGMWDHVVAMLVLTLVCSVALQFLHAP